MSSDSAISDDSAPEHAGRQGMIEYYVDELLLRIIDNSLDSTPQMFRHIAQYGPCVRPEQVLHIFGGSIIFRRTCDRMNIIRGAVLRDALDTAPADLRRWTTPERPIMDPPYQDYRDW